MSRRRVVVVGGGITGLATAWYLRHGVDGDTDAAVEAGVDVTVIEASPRLGGKIDTRDVDGVAVDAGADSFLARRPEGERLARRLGLGGELVAPATGQVWLRVRGELRPLPAGTVLGVPTDLSALARSGVLTPAGLVRAAAEPLVPRRPLEGDRAVADVVSRRFGRAVTEVLVEPLLGGVYAGRPDRLSIAAAAPPLYAAATSGGSFRAALRAQRHQAGTDDRPVFLTVAGGLGRVVEALAAGLDDVRTGTAVVGLASRAGGGGEAVLDGGERVPADAVVLTVPAFAAAPIVAPLAPDAARLLAAIEYASVAVVTLAYLPEVADRWPEGSGMLVPRREGGLVKAVTWSSRKWPHLAGRERFVVRASVGRVDDRRALALDDDDLAGRVATEVAGAVGVQDHPVSTRVTRWERSLPQYEVGHVGRVRDVRDALRVRAPWLRVAGAAYDGIGLAPCIAGAEAVATQLRAGG